MITRLMTTFCLMFFTLIVTAKPSCVTTLSAGPIGQAAPYLYNHHTSLTNAQALHLIIPPHQIIGGATAPPGGAPSSAFTLSPITFGWDSSLTIIEGQYWNDVVGVGSPNVPNFVWQMVFF